MANTGIVDDSKKLIEAKDEITKLQNSISGYRDFIVNQYNNDLLNRKSFLKTNSLVAGMTLEFRNIYGIQAPYYDIGENHLAIDYDGDGVTSEDDWLQLDDNKTYTFKDSPEMIYASKYSTDDETGTDHLISADQQRFFVDSKKADKGSKFHKPFCPPGLNRWSGTFLHNYICKPYELTEKYIYELITRSFSSKLPTITESFQVSGFNANNQICCYIDSTSKIVRHNYQYNVSDEELSEYLYDNKSSYNITNGAEDLSPIKIYDSGDVYIAENKIVEYYLTKSDASASFCYGYAVLVPTDTASENTEFYFDILTQNGDFGDVESWTKMYRNNGWMWGWATNYSRPWTVSGDYIAIFNPITQTSTTTFNKVKAEILTFYKSMMEEVMQYYDYYFEQGGSDTLDISKSTTLMNSVIDKIDAFKELQSASNLQDVITAIETRFKFVYNVSSIAEIELPPDRAVSINAYLQKNQSLYTELYGILNGRLNKRIGTLVNLYAAIQNTNIAMQAMTVKKENYSSLSKDIVAYNIVDGFDSDTITIKLETWETDMAFLSQMVRLTKAYVIDDNSNVIETRILDICKLTDLKLTSEDILPESATSDEVEQYAMFQVKLMDVVPETMKDYTPRIVRTIMSASL